ncbi:MAG: S-layer homology domain-containing protein [Lutispora sp.]
MKKILSVILALTLLFTNTLTIFADTPQTQGKVNLEKAIEIAKDSFGINTDGYDFNSSYYESGEGTKQHQLNWNSRKNGDGINITVDADTGDILYMNQWKNEYSNPTKLAKYKREEALKVAEELVKKLQPAKSKEMSYLDNSSSEARYIYDGNTYNFYFIRKVNGLDFQGNGVNISINKNSLEIYSYSFNWTKGTLPDASKAIGMENAKLAFNSKNGIELAYMMNYDQKTKKNIAKLVYAVKNGNRPIDAITGEVVNYGYYNPLYDMGGAGNAKMAQEAAILTPEEAKAVESTDKLMTKDKALEIAKKYVTIKEGQKLENASLYTDYYGANANWNFSWNYNNPEKNEYSYVSISIDAISGEVRSLSKYNSVTDNASVNGNPKYNMEKSKELAEKFLNMIAPEKFSQTEYRYDIYQNNSVEKPAYYNFNFIRKVNGIPFPGNSLNVNVNTYTGEITSYYSNWMDLKFPPSDNPLSIDEAYEALYKNAEFKLKYINHYDYTLKYPNNLITKLVYSFDDFSGMLDSKTGALLDYNGDAIKDKEDKAFIDIKGHWAENDILILLEAGIIEANSDEFVPNETIKQKDFIKILINSIQPNYQMIPYAANPTGEEYDEYYKQAIARKIITEKDKKMESEVSRIEVSKMIINAMTLGYLAKQSNIFYLNYKDVDKISQENKGYVAIVTGLGIMSGKDGSFAPDDKLTKGETAATIVKFLKVDMN